MGGSVLLVGIGPGDGGGITGHGKAALEQCDLMVGYTEYIKLASAMVPGKATFQTSMKEEEARIRYALEQGKAGKQVAVVCSGDPGVYGMAGLVFQLSDGSIPITVIPGVTAANSGAALLGAPLGHDFAVVSLSDLLTPWDVIEKRLRAAASADFAICLYNPSSKARWDYLQKACDIILCYQEPQRICGLAENIGREGENWKVLTLQELRTEATNMFTTVFIGNSQTKLCGGKMVTPRGYQL